MFQEHNLLIDNLMLLKQYLNKHNFIQEEKEIQII